MYFWNLDPSPLATTACISMSLKVKCKAFEWDATARDKSSKCTSLVAKVINWEIMVRLTVSSMSHTEMNLFITVSLDAARASPL